ncbi:signal transduction histidine kinase/DNA-binding response OmpR family regulator [Nitrospina gracilis Nb-211]|nr:signal transduction histidine kinase/DNA-binding response OmpR family regulator [Nitrospina gracilis Nb-211]
MPMSASKKVFGAILLVAGLVGMAGYLLLNHSQTILKERIAGEIQNLTANTLDSVNRIIFMRGEELQILAHELTMRSEVESSTRKMESMPDRDVFIRQMDEDWTAGKTTPPIQAILDNPLSGTFAEKRRFLKKKYGVEVFNEIFATNRFGALIAASPRTTDYFQADEAWYQQARKSGEDVHVEAIAYDESTDAFSTTVAVKLMDDSNRYQGMLKGGLHIVIIRNLLDDFQRQAAIHSLRFYLVNEKGEVILSSMAPSGQHDARLVRIHPFGGDLSAWAPVARALQGQSGYYFHEKDGQDWLVTYQRSKGVEGISGLNWSLVLEMDAKEVLKPVSILRAGLGGVWGVLFLAAFIMGGVMIYAFINPAEKLLKSTRLRVPLTPKSAPSSPVGKKPEEDLDSISFSFKELTDDLVTHLEELEKQVSTKAQALMDAKREAEKANQAKSLFISNMSHEIRTPLNAVLGYAQILDRDSNLDPKQKNKVKGIYHSGSRLLHLINDILDMSKIAARKEVLNVRPFDLGGLICEVNSQYGALCRSKKLQWVLTMFSGPSPVSGDKQKIHQVLSNLLDNAIKFTESGCVELRVTKMEADRFRFEVIDTGPGIPPEKQEAIFGVFEQGDVGLEKGGAGLGLAISRQLVQLMGGKLMLESQTDGSTRFFFELVLPPSRQELKVVSADLKKPVTLPPGVLLRVLIVDDDPTHLEIVQEMLRRTGMEVRTAACGEEGLAMLRKWNPDLLLVDYRMPAMNGLELICEISREYGPDRFKIIMVSASAFDQERQMFLEHGVSAFISKPLVREELLEQIGLLMSIEFVPPPQDSCVISDDREGDTPIQHANLSVPSVLVDEMKMTLSKGLFDEFEQLLAVVERFGPEEKKLANQLQRMAEVFDKTAITKELDRIPPHH